MLKMDQFEHGIFEHSPRAYDGIHMKLFNFDFFISMPLTFSYIFLNLRVFSVVKDLGPGHPSLPTLGFC